MGALSKDIASAKFHLDRLHLCWLLPFSKTEVLLPIKLAEEGLKTYPHLPGFLWDSLEEDHHLSGPISLSPCQLLHCFWKCAPRPREDLIATLPAHGHKVGWAVILPVLRQKGWDITLPLSFCRKPIKPEPNWNVRSSRRHKYWLKNVSIS